MIHGYMSAVCALAGHLVSLLGGGNYARFPRLL